jgi:hypothetical protein
MGVREIFKKSLCERCILPKKLKGRRSSQERKKKGVEEEKKERRGKHLKV